MNKLLAAILAILMCDTALGAELSLPSKPPVDLYGYTKFDACYDTSRISAGNFAQWVEPKGDQENQFNLTARQTRLGLNFSTPAANGIETSGKLEIDFYGGGPENKNLPMMRHAFMKLDWPKRGFSILAGQTSDVISPLVPSTVNYSVAWWVGDIGYRRPQLRLTKAFKAGANSQLLFQLAAVRPTDEGNVQPPNFQGRTALSFKKITLGVSGHWGEEEADLDTWSANLDLMLPIFKWLALTGEAWTGENLDAYLGGIGQGIRCVDADGDGKREKPVETIASVGGWAAIGLEPFKGWHFNLGGSLDDPDDADLNDADRSLNVSLFGNVLYDVNNVAQIGIEVSQWDTQYKNQQDRDSFRVQTALSYKF